MNKMGLGQIGGDGVIFRRKFKWYVTYSIGSKVISAFVKVAGRPRTHEQAREEARLCPEKLFTKNHWSGSDLDGEKKIYITHLGDMQPDMHKGLFDFFAQAWDANKEGKEPPKIEFSLVLYDGCGTPLETWCIHQATPTQIDFGDLDYSTNTDQMLEVEWKYESVDYELAETEINYLSHKSWIPGKAEWARATEPFDFGQGGK